MKKSVLFTTHADKALPLWKVATDQIYYYNDAQPGRYPEAREVYFRDPFNDPKDPVAEGRLSAILRKFFGDNPGARSVDGVREVGDFYHDDKWWQFEKLGVEFMPETWLARDKEFVPGEMVLKKRISCRCRDVYFDLAWGGVII